MVERVLNALVTRLSPEIDRAVTACIDARRSADAKQVRELVSEMEDVLEKFSRVVAREAMRRSREMKKTLDDEAPAATASVTPIDRKAAIRARARVATGGTQ